MTDLQPIIIKKKAAHGGHHGGAWKVAYADFVTAMMALFIVLWLLNTSKPTQEAVGGYFRDPKGTADKKGTDHPDAGNAGAAKKDDMSKIEEKMVKAMQQMAGFEKLKDQVEMSITAEGLKIELMESDKGTFFENGKAQATDGLTDILKVVSTEVAKLPNPILIEGHTDGKPYKEDAPYSNWELSADRANTARRLMESNGVRPDQISEVRGFADRHLRKPDAPEDASNRRVTLLIGYSLKKDSPGVVYDGKKALTVTPPATEAPPAKEGGTKEGAAKEGGTKEAGSEHPAAAKEVAKK